VNAGADQTIVLPINSISLDATVTDDGLPSGTLSCQWSRVSGTGTVTFGSATSVDTTAAFSAAGDYVLRLTANDGQLSASDDVTVTVDAEPVGNLYEAEDAVVYGAKIVSNNDGYTGTSFVDYANASDDYIEWTVYAGSTGVYNLSFRYALAAANRPLKLTVNGSVVDDSLDFNPTSSWSTWTNVSLNTNLVSGSNTVRLTAIGSSGGNVDSLTITEGGIIPEVASRIFIIGDSITQGNTSHNTYRRPLWHALDYNGYNVDFVGSLSTNYGGSAPNPDFDLDHEGHWGWRADEILAQINGWAASADPDIALIHLGTNDLIQGQSVSSTITDLGNIINALRVVNPDVKILLAKIIPCKRCDVTALNTAIVDLAAQKNSVNSQIVVVDQYTGFDMATDLYDDAHPDESGEQKMADKWYAALVPFLDGDDPVNHAPVVNAGADKTLTLPVNSVSLDATVTDDGLPSGTLNAVWTVQSGPDSVSFADDDSVDTVVSFVYEGTYVLRLTVSDGDKTSYDDITVTVNPSSNNSLFVKGINFGGDAVTIGGNAWLSYNAALADGLSFASIVSLATDTGVTPSPDVDDATYNMLNNAVWRSKSTLGVRQSISNGNYQIYIYVMENYADYKRKFNVSLEGVTCDSGIGNLEKGQWEKYGPYSVSVNDDELTMDLIYDVDSPHVMGMEIIKVQ
ncbi:MAG: carbohydrate-binding protein, partial [Planctomycetes bacterium]|nr:carbohydrate-binding protein [Planctomycetota bacterium]